jgi:hypothetical protein
MKTVLVSWKCPWIVYSFSSTFRLCIYNLYNLLKFCNSNFSHYNKRLTYLSLTRTHRILIRHLKSQFLHFFLLCHNRWFIYFIQKILIKDYKMNKRLDHLLYGQSISSLYSYWSYQQSEHLGYFQVLIRSFTERVEKLRLDYQVTLECAFNEKKKLRRTCVNHDRKE